jgi:hypothetical protein
VIGLGNARTMLAIRQNQQSLRAYVLQAVQAEVCTTGLFAKFDQALEAW